MYFIACLIDICKTYLNVPLDHLSTHLPPLNPDALGRATFYHLLRGGYRIICRKVQLVLFMLMFGQIERRNKELVPSIKMHTVLQKNQTIIE